MLIQCINHCHRHLEIEKYFPALLTVKTIKEQQHVFSLQIYDDRLLPDVLFECSSTFGYNGNGQQN
jgi:hypothetical protein